MQRTYFIDRLRVVLTSLVILHHAAITYGGSGSWFYREVRDGDTPTSLLLTAFCAVNQAYFMGMFFLLAGYFTPTSFARKGIRKFVRDRLLRLGVPLLAFSFILGPLTVALAGMPVGRSLGQAWFQQLSQAAFVIGPLWFVWTLLWFDMAYVVWRCLRPWPAHDPARPVPRSSMWLLMALAVGAAALVLRQVVPVGENVLGVQLGYFASYVFLFFLGSVGSRYAWIERLERGQAWLWGWVTLFSIPVLFAVAALSGALAGQSVNFNGGFGLAAVVYAFWEPLVAWGVIASLLVLFRDRFNVPSVNWECWGAQAYGAFIVHAPVVVGLSIALMALALPPVLKFAIVGAGGIVASFAVSAGLRRLPGVGRIV